MNKLFYILTFALSFSFMTAYSPPDSCLKLYDIPFEDTFENPDSVKADSCEWSDTYTQFYGKGLFYTKMNYNIIPRNGTFPEDTIIEYTLNDIPSKFTKAISDFLIIENRFGKFYFREHAPHVNDTTSQIPRTFEIRFENYVNIDSVEYLIENFESVDVCGFVSWFLVLSDVEGDYSNEFNLYLSPNPATESIRLEFTEIPKSKNINIYTMEGVKVMTIPFNEQIQDVNISKLTHGIYFLNIGQETVKFIKK